MPSMQVPSGAYYHAEDINLIRAFIEYGCIRYSDKPFTLNSGIQSNVYVYLREDITDNPDLELLLGRKICDVIEKHAVAEDKQVCLIGLPTAGTALASAAALSSAAYSHLINDQVVCHRIMKEVSKTHGAHTGWFNGKPDSSRHTYWRVDNVVTDGATKMKAEEKFQADGYPSVFDSPEQAPSLIVVDRQQGGLARLSAQGFKRLYVVYNLLDITYACENLKLWPADAVRRVEEEIKSHQL
jgi:orotate phosphoribosyltransferase